LSVLGLTAYTALNRSQENSLNAKVLSDLTAIQNALDRYKQDNNGSYPVPDPNQVSTLCFTPTATYTHTCQTAFFLQTPLTVQILGPRYLPNLPSDPRTGSPYLYGVTYDGRSMQVAASYWDKQNQTWIAKTQQHFAPDFPLNSLIRSYNSPNFVVPEGMHLPYNPHRLQISAQLLSFAPGTTLISSNNQKINLGPDPNLDPNDPNNPDPNNPHFNPNLNPDSPLTLHEGDTLSVPQGQRATLYFSDGSISTVGSSTSQTTLQILAASDARNPNTPNSPDNDPGPVTKVFLKLTEGRIFNKVTRLSQASEFNIQTTSSIAGVRGTEFGLEVGTGENNTDRLYLFSGSVSVRQKTEAEKQAEKTQAQNQNSSTVLTKADLDQELWTLSSDQKLIVVDITTPGINPLDNQPTPSTQPAANLPPNLMETLMKEYYPETLTQTVLLTTALRPLVLEVDAQASQVRLSLPDPNLNNSDSATPKLTHAIVCSEPLAQLCEAESPKACDAQQKCLSFPLPDPEPPQEGEESSHTLTYLINTPDLFLPNQDPTQNPKRFALADLTDPKQPLLSAFSLPALFFDPNTTLTPQDIDSYGMEVIDISPNQTDPLKDDPQVKCEIMGSGVWKDGSCWVLGAENQDCNQACTSFGEQYHLPTLACDPGEWNDTSECEVCKELVGPNYLSQNNSCIVDIVSEGPFYAKDTKKCYFAFQDQDCSYQFEENRVCKCIGAE